MKYFDALEGQTSITVTEKAQPVVERVTVSPVSVSASHLLTGTDGWTWSELRDYVVREIESIHGPQARNPKIEASIFKSFLSRWPDGQAIQIAKAAFEIYGGWWGNAPISVNRFCKGSDEYFAAKILAKLER